MLEEKRFKLQAPYQPTGDQPAAIEALVKRIPGRQSMPDFTRSYGLWQDFYDGKCHCPVEQTNAYFSP